MKQAVEITGMEYTYRTDSAFAMPALREVSLTVRSGELIALIGPTGSGKSTFLQVIAGLLLPRHGTTRVLDLDLSNPRLSERDMDSHRRRVVLAMQRPEDMLFKTYLGDDIAYGPLNYGLRGQELARRVKTAMETMGLDYAEYKDRRTDALSGGEKRKGALAGVLALDPEILLLDEPAAGLDPASTGELFALIARLNRQGKTIIFSTHDMNQAQAADRIILFAEGRVRAVLPPAELFSQSRLLSEVGLLPPDAVMLAAELKRLGLELAGTAVPADIEALSDLIAENLAPLSAGGKGGGV